ncbi:MAG: hypothetical protein CVT63_04855 [Candidatus Anoxymicrobium japonicum]|uniref:Energy-coupling factor transporter transmembrane protein EcfT n=1 Tax=Candidatus Anoxymicrobium japonicum TaxID=2013648 RepID=A0A2N3G610_9ACTN|nr:MAG: hypothetical protein CVT63_04855 [Candidatus Anoxymicrobium japonicum]
MIPVYRKNGSFLQGLHPATQLALAGSLIVAALTVDNPLFQFAIILATAILAASAGVLREWLSWWKLCAAISLAALIINPLVSRHGATVVWRGPSVPVFGHLFVTAEAILYGAGMGLRLASMIWVFALVTLTVDPDNVLGLLKGRGAKSALVSALTMRMAPTMMSDAGDLLDAMRSRGIVLDSGSKWMMFKSRLPLVKRLFATSLDRGISLAEAMESRAYGSGKRTRYHRRGFRGGDAATVAASLAILGAGVAGIATGAVSFKYFPTLYMKYTAGTLFVVAAPVVIAFSLLFLSTVWKRSNWLKLRI